MNKNMKKIILILLILFIISGIIILGTIGFNKSINYQAGTRIEVSIPKGYNKQEIENIAKENFKEKNIYVEEIEKLNQVVAVKIKNYTQEELESFKTQIMEKYNIDKDSLQIYEVSIPATKIKTIIKPYILPILLINLLSFAYLFIRIRKSDKKLEKILKKIAILFITLGLYFSLILIFRLPFGIYTMPVAVLINMITLIIFANNISKL